MTTKSIPLRKRTLTFKSKSDLYDFLANFPDWKEGKHFIIGPDKEVSANNIPYGELLLNETIHRLQFDSTQQKWFDIKQYYLLHFNLCDNDGEHIDKTNNVLINRCDFDEQFSGVIPHSVNDGHYDYEDSNEVIYALEKIGISMPQKVSSFYFNFYDNGGSDVEQ